MVAGGSPSRGAGGPSAADARRFLDACDFPWHQQFDLVPGVRTPGPNPIEYLLGIAALPPLESLSVLDVGTFNGGVAFMLERLGAARVVALDTVEPHALGFAQVKEFLGSEVTYVQGSVYDLEAAVGDEKFDLVFLWGVIYHLRHPLLALDNVRGVMREHALAYVESAVGNRKLGRRARLPLAQFYRGGELGGDPTNWFVPSVACLEDWCASSGLYPVATVSWPQRRPARTLITAGRVPEPEFVQLSTERPMRAVPAPP